MAAVTRGVEREWTMFVEATEEEKRVMILHAHSF